MKIFYLFLGYLSIFEGERKLMDKYDVKEIKVLVDNHKYIE